MKHFLEECPPFDSQREALRDIVTSGLLKWPEATQFLVSSAEAFHVIAGFWKEALYLKENE